jgi:hypothetical protein
MHNLAGTVAAATDYQLTPTAANRHRSLYPPLYGRHCRNRPLLWGEPSGDYDFRDGEMPEQYTQLDKGPQWSLAWLAIDCGGIILSAVMVIGLAAVVARRRTLLTPIGERALVVYLAHLYIMPLFSRQIAHMILTVASVTHPEVVGPLALLT